MLDASVGTEARVRDASVGAEASGGQRWNVQSGLYKRPPRLRYMETKKYLSFKTHINVINTSTFSLLTDCACEGDIKTMTMTKKKTAKLRDEGFVLFTK
jgi:hypothetical protein